MNLSIYFIFFLISSTSVYFGIRFSNKWILFPSLAVSAMSAILIIATLLLVYGIK